MRTEPQTLLCADATHPNPTIPYPNPEAKTKQLHFLLASTDAKDTIYF
jgi:hypothetical protein